MHFGSISLDDALGIILAHSTRVGDRTLKKGRALTVADIARLRAAGHAAVIGARLAADDVAEDAAAARIAAMVAGAGTRVAAAFTGRANIFATVDGLALIDAAALARLNGLDESITLATVAANTRVTAGQMLATVKIIPFAVPEAVLARAAETTSGIVAMAPIHPHRVGLILTAFAGTKPQVLARRRDAVATRLAALGCSIEATRTVAHTTAAVGDAILDLMAQKLSPILIFAASAIVDRADVIPAGLVAAGGAIERLGMPVDPGNLLLLGRLGDTPVIGLPSCAASLKLNGFDWVLERTLAGVAITSADIAGMGLGGLLQEIDSRPQPRLGVQTRTRHAPAIAALVLAAGRSTRMGPENKLLASIGGTPIVRRVVETAMASSARPVHVVVGHQAERVRAALSGLDVVVVDNPHFAAGLSTSLKAGLASLPATVGGTFVMLGDMPEIDAGLIDRMIAAFAPTDGRTIVLPIAGGKRGNPVLWARAHFSAMAAVSGDTGARHLLGLHADEVVEIAADISIHADIDTPAALAALRSRQSS